MTVTVGHSAMWAQALGWVGDGRHRPTLTGVISCFVSTCPAVGLPLCWLWPLGFKKGIDGLEMQARSSIVCFIGEKYHLSQMEGKPAVFDSVRDGYEIKTMVTRMYARACRNSSKTFAQFMVYKLYPTDNYLKREMVSQSP